MDLGKETEHIFNRQFERMKAELVGINTPMAYLTIISKYWDFARQDIERIVDNAIQDRRQNNH